MRLSPTAAALLCLAAAGCGRGFVSARDYPRVADCYAAFFSAHMDAMDPGLGLSLEQVGQAEQITMQGVNRMTPFIVEAKKSAGGDRKFLQLVAAWRKRPEFDVSLASTPKAKAMVYGDVLDEAESCHKTLDQWSAVDAAKKASPAPPKSPDRRP